MSRLFTPIAIGGLTLQNRIAISPMSQFRATDGLPSAWHRSLWGMLAESGAGLGIVEDTAVLAEGRTSEADLCLYTDAHEAALRRLLQDLRSHCRMPMGIQLGHSGRKAATYPAVQWDDLDPQLLGRPLPDGRAWGVVGPSALAYDQGWQIPEPLDDAGILRIIDAFAASAMRAVRAGFDLIEVHAAHGYLLHSFRSAQSNIRQDDWGGSVQNRARIVVETARAIRRAIPQGVPLGFRLNGEDWSEGGVTLGQTADLAAALKVEGVDYVVISAGNNVPGTRLPPLEPGYMVAMAAEVRRVADMPVMAVGMIVNGPHAEAILARGAADMVAIGRGMLDDPRWGWHAAYELEGKVWNSGMQARVNPRRWPGYCWKHRKDLS